MVLQLKESVDLIDKKALGYDRDIEETYLEFTVVGSQEVFKKRPRFPYSLNKAEIIESLNEVLNQREVESSYNIASLDDIILEENRLPGDQVFVFSVQKRIEEKQEHVLNRKPEDVH